MAIINLIKNISALTAAQVVSAVSNFLGLAIVARLLGSGAYGDWTLYVNAFSFGALALSFGLPPAINHYLAAGKLNKRDLIGQLLVFSLLMATVFFIGAYLIARTPLATVMLPSILPVAFIVGGLSAHFFLLLFNQLLQAILLAEHAYRKLALISSFGGVAMLLTLAIVFYTCEVTSFQFFQYLIIINLLIQVLLTAAYLNRITKLEGYKFRFKVFSQPVFMLLVSFSAWVYITNFLQFLNYKLDVWLITAFLGDKSQLGIYALTVSLSQLIWLIPNAFQTVIFTETSRSDTVLHKTKIYSWSKNIFFLALAFAVIGYTLSFWLVPLFFSRGYNDVIGIFPYLLPGIVIFAPSILWSGFFAGQRRIDINFRSSLYGFILCIILNLVLIPRLQIIGAAIASSCSYILSSAYLFWRFRRSET